MANLTDHEQRVLDAYIELGGKQAVANAMGISRSSVRHAINAIERKGLAPWLSANPIPEHLTSPLTTVHYKNGEVVEEWRRLSPTVETMKRVIEGLCDEVKGKGKCVKRTDRKTDANDMLFELDIFDAHVGMFADEKETLDENYDCDIAAKRMVEVAEGLARRSNRPAKCVLVFGGDMLHSDSRNNRTELSGNVLDVDTRYQRVVEYIIAASRDVVNIAATIAAEVEIIVLSGNHSWHSEVWLAQVLNAFYSNCANIKVNISRSPRRHLVFGQNLLTWAHGDRINPKDWQGIISTEFAKEWGATKFRHHKCGHVHHKKAFAPIYVDEQKGLLVEYLEALCATDSWHANSGFIGNQRGASAFEYHKEFGLMTRFFQPA